MHRHRLYTLLAAGLILAALGFLAYALNHPEASFPWSNQVSFSLYGLYGIVTLTVCAAAWRTR